MGDVCRIERGCMFGPFGGLGCILVRLYSTGLAGFGKDG